MTDINPGQPAATTTVLGYQVGLYESADNTYVEAIVQGLHVQSSPLVVYFDPPLPISQLNPIGIPQIEAAIAHAIGNE